MSPELAGEFFTTEPPEKPSLTSLMGLRCPVGEKERKGGAPPPPPTVPASQLPRPANTQTE